MDNLDDVDRSELRRQRTAAYQYLDEPLGSEEQQRAARNELRRLDNELSEPEDHSICS